jgi:hypothetical protein
MCLGTISDYTGYRFAIITCASSHENLEVNSTYTLTEDVHMEPDAVAHPLG